ncbi:MerR family transcriptional regulator [Niallia taxi]|uniref:MerR family transcriptional regulator n=2 Tax=Niallia taxi TaxID=2499688 RepID=UPI0012440EC1|nr:MerR family transcriptional regulator [Niallia taxi]MDK8640748.1 MerR family transcriptional regulator [Niallia taxi]
MLTVKEVANLLDLTEHTVRYYTDKGLVPSLKRDKNNNRLFDEESINWLKGAKFLKQAGMSVASIKNYIELCLQGDYTIPERYKIIMEQQAIALARLEEATAIAKQMEAKAKHYEGIMNLDIPDDMNPGKWKENKHQVGVQ